MKKTLTTVTLALVLSFGATIANAGILVADRSIRQTTCSETASQDKGGKFVFGRNTGIIVFGAAITYLNTGIIVFGAKDTSCTEPEPQSLGSTGIIVFG